MLTNRENKYSEQSNYMQTQRGFRETNYSSYFSVDKLEHFVCHFILSIWVYCILAGFFKFTKVSAALLSVVTCFVIGLLVEVLETTWAWVKIMRFIGETDVTPSEIDKRDLVVNTIGAVAGTITILFIQLL